MTNIVLIDVTEFRFTFALITHHPIEEDDECFKWAVIAALHYEEIGNDPQ